MDVDPNLFALVRTAVAIADHLQVNYDDSEDRAAVIASAACQLEEGLDWTKYDHEAAIEAAAEWLKTRINFDGTVRIIPMPGDVGLLEFVKAKSAHDRPAAAPMIAAAPDLLAACKALLARVDAPGGTVRSITGAEVAAIRAAIANAEGGAGS